jgi:DNA-3-methyladenine glycosylase
VVVAARGLLGALLIRDDGLSVRTGRIVEVEAYGGPGDLASHARSGPTARNAAMFAPSGRAYVYGVYGTVRCLNVVTGPAGDPAAILLRAATPIAGADAMRASRVRHAIASRRPERVDPAAAAARLSRVPDARLAVGPGNLAAAFEVGLGDDGVDLLDPAGSLRLAPRADSDPPFGVLSTPRVGVAYAGPEWADRPWRFVIASRRGRV